MELIKSVDVSQVGMARLVNPQQPTFAELLGLLDFASLEINKSKPRRLVLIICRLQSTNVASIGIHPLAATRFTDVTAVAAFWRAKIGDLLYSGFAVVSSSVV